MCEYWDPAKGRNINRDYVVYLQHKVRNLELQLEKIDKDEDHDDPEVLVRSGAAVKLGDAGETKYLGPSSGTQMTRIVMQLAKQFTDSKTIKDIVTESKARHVKDLFSAEADKPTSKIYPLTSDVAAEELPNRSLTDLLVQLYNLKGALRLCITRSRLVRALTSCSSPANVPGPPRALVCPRCRHRLRGQRRRLSELHPPHGHRH